MADFSLIHRAPTEARGVTLSLVEGELPRELRGTVLRNGPGLQQVGDTPLHFLDGYGFVAAAHFDGERVVHHARNVDLPLARAEREAGRVLERRPFTNRTGGRLANLFRMKLSTGAAHDVYPWGGSVVASDVGGHYCLDARSFDTTGPAPLNALGGGLSQLAAMPRIDPHTGRLVAHVMTPGVVGADRVTIVEYDAQWNETARIERSLGVKGALLHDLIATEHHYVLAQFGMLDVAALALGGGVPLDAVRLPPGGAKLLAIPRRGDGPILSMPLADGFQTFHLVNAYEEGGKLVADATEYEGMLDFSPLHPAAEREGLPRSTGKGPYLARHVIDLASGKHSVTQHRNAAGESPSVRDELCGRKHRYAYVSAQGSRGDEPVDNAYYWYHGVAKLDCDAGTTVGLWDAGPRVFVSAPQFVTRGDAEDDGWLITWTHDVEHERGELVVLDARALDRGPIARFALPAPLPPASHVAWMPA
jgi:all-trans-8'-apo-beta-carotenal 15,15'-oxygenase